MAKLTNNQRKALKLVDSFKTQLIYYSENWGEAEFTKQAEIIKNEITKERQCKL